MKFFPEFMHYTRLERKGIQVLFLLATIFFLIPKTLPWFKKKQNTDFTRLERYAADISNSEITEQEKVNLFPFDPNTLPFDSLLLMGLPEKTARTIINYRSKVSRFSHKTDLQKIYTLSDEQYKLLEPFIIIGKSKKATRLKKSAAQTALFDFDPNTISLEELKQLGFSEKTAGILINYRNKGGFFKVKTDLKKVYGVDQELFNKLEDHIIIPQPAKGSKISRSEKSLPYPTLHDTAPAAPIDINAANAETWQSLKGIGPSYAKRITRYREKLGGFCSIDQVATTYGLPDSTFQNIKPFLKLSPVFRKIDINSASIEDMKQHPYISSKIAQLIVSYRGHHGHFQSIEDLAKIRAFDQKLVIKLEPYLNFDGEM